MSKGSSPRPLSISPQELGNRLELIFGKKPPKERYVPPALPKEIDNSSNIVHNKTIDSSVTKEN